MEDMNLNPCPKCKGNPKFEVKFRELTRKSYADVSITCEKCGFSDGYTCVFIGTMGERKERQRLIERWNAR